MKIFKFIIFLILLLSMKNRAQEFSFSLELYTIIDNLNNGETIQILLEPRSAAWCRNGQSQYDFIPNPHVADEFINYSDIGFDFGFDNCNSTNSAADWFYVATYRLSINLFENSNTSKELFYCYIDWRDSQMGDLDYDCQSDDIIIEYDRLSDLAYYNYGVPPQSFYYDLINGQYLTCWNINECGQHETNFPNYWQNSLAFIDQNNNPYLFWQQDDGSHQVSSYFACNNVNV